LLSEPEDEPLGLLDMIGPLNEFAFLASKLYKNELEDEDWNAVVQLSFKAAVWLWKNSRVEATPTSNQIHVQPLGAKKKKKKKKNVKS
jgi:hypothetical protein